MLPVRPGKKTELPHTGITTLSVNDRYQCEIEGKYTKAGDMIHHRYADVLRMGQ